MFDNIINFFKKFSKETKKDSKDMAKERLHLVLMQDRANVSADFLEMMKQEIIEVIKKYIDVDENSIDVKLTNKVNSDGTTGAPALYANIPIISLKDETKKVNIERKKEEKTTENEENVRAKSVENTKEQDKISTDENIEKSENEETAQEDKKVEKKETQEDTVKENIENVKEEAVKDNIDPEESIKEESKEDNIVEQEEVKEQENEDSEKTEVE